MPAPSPPKYFKCCKLLKINSDSIHLEMDNWPTCIMAGGNSTNLSASNKLFTPLGLSPHLCYAVHAVDGSIKRLTNSEIKIVLEVLDFLLALQSILRHFQLSGRSTAMLNGTLKSLNTKTLHMISFCPTRMSCILTACKQTSC